jgi:hypothetical protein
MPRLRRWFGVEGVGIGASGIGSAVGAECASPALARHRPVQARANFGLKGMLCFFRRVRNSAAKDILL